LIDTSVVSSNIMEKYLFFSLLAVCCVQNFPNPK
jgi:hypothetical protein